MAKASNISKQTKVTTLGRDPLAHSGSVNPPVHRTSTILFPTIEALQDADNDLRKVCYARGGNPTINALQDAIAELDGADHALVTASGLSGVYVALFAFLQNGDHVLMVDAAYGSTRSLCIQELPRFGVEVTFYDPHASAEELRSMMKANTKVVFVESPGSLTFEMQDIPAIAAMAHEHGAVVISDSTWATPLYQQPFDMGIDVNIHSATKYIAGHSDLMMAAITFNDKHYDPLTRFFRNVAPCASSDNCYLALRGLRSMAVRMQHQQQAAMKVAQWLHAQPEVDHVLYPALPDDPGYALWKRDMSGAASLFGVLFKQGTSDKATNELINNLKLFGIGFSWGGYESLAIKYHPANLRKASNWKSDQIIMRVYVGLEDPDDLIKDLEAGFNQMRKTAAAA